MAYFDDNENGEDDLVYYDPILLDRILQGMSILTSIACTHNISGTVENMQSKYLAWIMKDIKRREENNMADFYQKSELIEKLLMINDFYNFLNEKCASYTKTRYNSIKDSFLKFKGAYIKWCN